MRPLFLSICFMFLSAIGYAQTVVDVIVNSAVHETLETAVVEAELAATLSGDGPFTVFAPTDDAFAALPDGVLDELLSDPTGELANILLYHVLDGEVLSTDLSDGQVATTLLGEDITVTIDGSDVFINDAQVTMADIPADNGVVHVINAVLTPPPATVVDVIANSDVHETLEAAIEAAELTDALSNEFGQFTVFAPTDDAFAALPDGLLDELLDDPTGELTNILTYHVLAAEFLAADLSDGQIIATLQGENIEITIDGDNVFVNDAQVTVTDLQARNGVVHVIDAVLTPPPTTVVDIIAGTGVHETLESALILAGLDETLEGEGPFTVFAPTDDAFNALPEEVLQALVNDPMGELTEVLLYHVLEGEVLSTGLSDGQTATTLLGEDIEITIDGDNVFINDAQVTMADVQADNGVVHVIDAVLTPLPATVVDIIVDSEVHETLETAVIEADLAGPLTAEGPFTVFAPTDDAFAALPDGVLDELLENPTGELANILLYHVLGAEVFSTDLVDGQTATTLLGEDIEITIDGDNVFINDAQVIVADLEARNGVVHVIDAVLLPPPATVVDIIVNSEVHETLETAVIEAELAGTLSGEGPFTVFAPTDDAFAALPDGVLDELLENPTGELADILLYHVLGAEVFSTDLVDGQTATTLLGEDIEITIDGDNVFINDAQVIVADLEARNGVVHVIDAVLLPPPATVVDIIVNSEVHETLETAVIEAELAGTLSGEGPFTVFAPTDDAFAALPDGVLDELLENPTGELADILLYHVLGAEVFSSDLSDGQTATTLLGEDIEITIDGDNVFINDAQVIVADLEARNGVVHVIDAVLLPPPATVVDIIVNSEVHETLETAVIEAELAGTLSGEGPFTVFAPTDDAFAALPDGVLDELLENPTGELADILLYHVLGAEVFSSDLSDGQTATTLLGEDIEITIDGDNVFINDAQVIMADIEADNGVVHVIDAVLLPPEPTTVVDIIVNSEVHETLETAVTEAGLVETLSGEGPFTVFAPTDDAFAALPDGILDALLADPAGDLTEVLLYHVLGAEVFSTDLSDGQMAMTLQGENITVTIDGSNVFINDAQVIMADIEADNGVVHVIDAVLVPSTITSTRDLLNVSDQVKLFPNPTSDYLMLDLQGSLGQVVEIRIINALGQPIKRWDDPALNNRFNITGLQSGNYFVEILMENQVAVKPFVVK